MRMARTATTAGPSIEPSSAQRERNDGRDRRCDASRRARRSGQPSVGGSTADVSSARRRSAMMVWAISVSSSSHRRQRARWSNADGVKGLWTRCSTQSVRAGRYRAQASFRPKIVTIAAAARGARPAPRRAHRSGPGLGRQVIPKRSQRVVEARLDRPEPDPEGRGGLLQGEAVEVVEDDHAAMLRRQRGQAVADPAAEFLALGVFGRLDPVVAQALAGGVVHRARRQAPATVRRVAQVERDPVEPRQRRAIAEQVRPMLVGADEGVLEDFLGELAVAGEAEGRPEHVGPIPLVERLEHVEIVRLHPADQVGVGDLCGDSGRDGRVVLRCRSPSTR